MLTNEIYFLIPTYKDIDFLVSLYNDDGIKEMSLNTDNIEIGKNEVMKTINYFNKNKLDYYVIFLDSKKIGVVMIYDVNLVENYASIGIALLKDFRGKGYGKEVVKLISLQIKDKYNILNLRGEVYSNNNYSLKFVQKLGFVKNENKATEIDMNGTKIIKETYDLILPN